MLEIINKVSGDFEAMGYLFMNDPKFAVFAGSWIILGIYVIVTYWIISFKNSKIKNLANAYVELNKYTTSLEAKLNKGKKNKEEAK